jgi:hypothetical protein
MINLIPQSAKKAIKIEYWVRVVTAWSVLITGALLGSVVIMAPAYVLIDLQTDANEESSAAATEKIAGYESVAKDLTRSNVEAKAVLDTTSYVPMSDNVEMIRELENSSVVVSDIVISRSKDGFSPIQVRGEAASRQALAQFRDDLLANPTVANVDLPISNLAKDKDIQFNISVTLKKQTP